MDIVSILNSPAGVAVITALGVIIGARVSAVLGIRTGAGGHVASLDIRRRSLGQGRNLRQRGDAFDSRWEGSHGPPNNRNAESTSEQIALAPRVVGVPTSSHGEQQGKQANDDREDDGDDTPVDREEPDHGCNQHHQPKAEGKDLTWVQIASHGCGRGVVDAVVVVLNMVLGGLGHVIVV